MTKKRIVVGPVQPDAWLRLVLQTMGIDELRREIASATGDERRWLEDELQRKEAGRA